MTHTSQTVAALIRKNIEPETADVVLAALKPLDGTPITTRLLDKLPGGRVEWRLTRQLGWTEIRRRDGMSFILARSEASVPLSVEFVERENSQHFAGRRERNRLRERALADTALLERVATLMNRIEKVNHERAALTQAFAAYIEHGGPLWPDHFDLERACGLRDRKDTSR